MKICVVGGGISSHGFLLGILYKLEKLGVKCSNISIDIYCLGGKIEIDYINKKFSLPNSDTVGYLNRWGATFALINDKTEESEYLHTLLNIDSNKLINYEKESATGYIQTSYLSCDVQYFNEILNNKIRLLNNLITLNKINEYVIKLTVEKNKIKVETSKSKIDYDYVILCGGSIETANLLFKSSLINSPDLKILDHGLDFSCEKYEFQDENYFYPGVRNVQCITSKKNFGFYTHCSVLNRMTHISNQGISKFYPYIAGKKVNEILYEKPFSLAGELIIESLTQLSLKSKYRKITVAVTSDNSCEAILILSKEKNPKIIWKSNFDLNLLSAFHFHGSLIEVNSPFLNSESRIIIGDLSNQYSLIDRNIGAFSFKKGFKEALHLCHMIGLR